MTIANEGQGNSKAAAEAKEITCSGKAASGKANVAEGEAQHPDTRKGDRRRQNKASGVERRRSSRRYSDRIAASFTSAFVAQWLGQEIADEVAGNEVALHRSARLVYAAVQEREAQYYRSLGQHVRKTQDYS